MPKVSDANPREPGRSEDEPIKREIETALENLLDVGDLELPLTGREAAIYDHIQPSNKAKTIAGRAPARLLDRLGLSTLGAYIAQTRESRGIQRGKLARTLRLAQDVLTEIETNRAGLFVLSPVKAADLVQHLGLDSKVVVNYLMEPNALLTSTQAAATSFFRIDKEASEKTRRASEEMSHKTSTDSDQRQQLEKFLEAFVKELTQRGLLGK